jgi:hypothetical protein
MDQAYGPTAVAAEIVVRERERERRPSLHVVSGGGASRDDVL